MNVEGTEKRRREPFLRGFPLSSRKRKTEVGKKKKKFLLPGNHFLSLKS